MVKVLATGKENKDEVEFETELNNVTINLKTLQKIQSYTNAVDSEVGGLLYITNGGDIKIEDAYILEQEANSCLVELDEKALGKFIEDMAKKNPEKLKNVRGWWHSHSNGNVFWSSTDDDTTKNFLKYTGSSVVYSLVTNKDADLLCRADINTELGNIKIDNLPVSIDLEIKDSPHYAKIAKKLVKPKKYNYEKYCKEWERPNTKIIPNHNNKYYVDADGIIWMKDKNGFLTSEAELAEEEALYEKEREIEEANWRKYNKGKVYDHY